MPGTDRQAYGREHTISADGKPSILGSADPAFRGDAARWNPEDLLVAALAACHKLWYLHRCARSDIRVLAYRDAAVGTMAEDAATGVRFTRVVLRPRGTIRYTYDIALAERLQAEAPMECFIANAGNFQVEHEPTIERMGTA